MTTTQLMTPYQVSKVVNEMLTARNLKNIPPQMCYNYVRNGLIKSTNGHVSVDDAAEWAEKYVSKKAERAAK